MGRRSVIRSLDPYRRADRSPGDALVPPPWRQVIFISIWTVVFVLPLPQYLYVVQPPLCLAASSGAVSAAPFGPWQRGGTGQVVLVPVGQVRPLMVVVMVSVAVEVIQGLSQLHFPTCSSGAVYLTWHTAGQVFFLQRFQILPCQIGRFDTNQRGRGTSEPP